MKIPQKSIIGLLIICFCLSAGIVFAQIDNEKVAPSLNATNNQSMDTKKLEENLKKLSKKDLLDEINSLAKISEERGDLNTLIPYATVLLQRQEELNDLDCINIIKDNVSTITMKEIMVDLYTIKNEKRTSELNNTSIKQLLKEKNIDKRVKAKIVAKSAFSKNDTGILEELIQDDDGILAFNSLKKLTKIDDLKAYTISSEILLNYKKESKDKVMAALKSTSKYLKNNRTNKKVDRELENKFIDFSFEIINSDSDELIKDTALFSISDLMTKEAISKIIKSKSLDRELKIFSIDQNFMTLKDALVNNPTESDIEIVVDAMELMPISDLAKDLEKAISTIKDDNLKLRCKKVIENMKLNGHKGNIKWEFHPKSEVK